MMMMMEVVVAMSMRLRTRLDGSLKRIRAFVALHVNCYDG